MTLPHCIRGRGPALIGATVAMLALLYWVPDTNSAILNQRTWPVAALDVMIQLFSFPALAAGAAWQTGRLRRGAVFGAAPSRGLLHVHATNLWPLLLGAALLPLANFAMAKIFIPGWPDLATLALGMRGTLPALAAVAFGAVLGRYLPPLIAVPAAGFFTYQFILTGYWVHSFRWRHIFGFDAQVLPGERMDTVASLATVLPWAALIAGFTVLACHDRFGPRLIIKLPAAIICFALATSLTAAVNSRFNNSLAASNPRKPTELVCLGSQPTVCVWPEQAPLLTRLQPLAQRVSQTYNEYGIPVPDTASSAAGAEGWPVYFSWKWTDEEYVLSMASNARTFAMPPCAEQGQEWAGMDIASLLQAWQWLTFGASPQETQARFGPEAVTIASQKRTLPKKQQGEWFMKNFQNAHHCGTEPVK